MTWDAAARIADALLYEGYLLYPYRGSATKNRYRWQFGVVAPAGCGGDEHVLMQTECLIEAGPDAELDVAVRFLQAETRLVEQLVRPPDEWRRVDTLTVDDRELVTWDEARPCTLEIPRIPLGDPAGERSHRFTVDGGGDVEPIRDAGGAVVARVVRERLPIDVRIDVAVQPAGALRKLRICLHNETPCQPADCPDRAARLHRSLIAAHTLVAIRGGSFVSLLEPPAQFAELAAGCRNVNTWPVLVGERPRRDVVLSSPIILYDYPSIAPESPGDLFDATEIDEMLTLRVLTLTDDERRAAAATDPHARRLIERAQALPPETRQRLHGAIRSLRPAAGTLSSWEGLLNPPAPVDDFVMVQGRRVTKGSRVRLRARADSGARADAMDMFLVGQPASVAAVYRDLENDVHLAVTIDAAAASDLHAANGRYFYFRPDEIDVIDEPSPGPARARRVLVAGIGNIFLADDGFGPAVVQRLASRARPDWVRIEDFGIRGIHLAYELLGATPPYDTTILVDAVSRGAAPGTLFVIEPEVDGQAAAPPDAHSVSVESVLAYLKQIGGSPGRVLVVGCESGSITPGIGLSEAVAAAVEGAADIVMELVANAGAGACA